MTTKVILILISFLISGNIYSRQIKNVSGEGLLDIVRTKCYKQNLIIIENELRIPEAHITCIIPRFGQEVKGNEELVYTYKEKELTDFECRATLKRIKNQYEFKNTFISGEMDGSAIFKSDDDDSDFNQINQGSCDQDSDSLERIFPRIDTKKFFDRSIKCLERIIADKK
ncbi:MAG: hypothetical protein A2381_10990 [Bdellovibrionales bacterium RIFOXYB1_FULL_37_110]|nr:MAG: hypothetical protein A2181_07130 [Bdellovibrionales bacterium RIFOXYA1_FULL_38_20]OFZ51190.1 MAG: hypothetical protein A2417_17975 [Bdellovibrionales bacterium RIFOXYC1_FULL_37_79]OFZ61296.1 MAG: hypothetical protein A2381_10990 [Bdellovibrionales bacterium RIFOXYB1_FULL_37_110]OFZ62159.1 MAG: hypothetical protein A2577_14565 [Bdellovibrionales bacterium RIFOXYD1_FULL_36_51]